VTLREPDAILSAMLKRIHVNQHAIRRNRVAGSNEPPLTIKTYHSNTKARRVEILGPSEVVYSPDKPLPCGARVWIETKAPVVAHSDTTTLLN
jgi:hypothetical protein